MLRSTQYQSAVLFPIHFPKSIHLSESTAVNAQTFMLIYHPQVSKLKCLHATNFSDLLHPFQTK